MIINHQNLQLFVNAPHEEIKPEQIPIILLHGFTGNSSDWTNFTQKFLDSFYSISIDILGHGRSSSPKMPDLYSEDSLVEQLHTIITSLNLHNFVLLGYSMGGRLAISYAVKYPAKTKALILESSTPGIQDIAQRKERMLNDKKLAESILKNGIDSFVDYWMEIPLFQTLKHLPQETFDKISKQKKQNNPIGLANSLKGFSTGEMRNHWDDLNNLPDKTLLITGELDTKYTEIAKQIKTIKPAFNHQIIEKTGHNTHLENPEEFFILVDGFLRTLK